MRNPSVGAADAGSPGAESARLNAVARQWYRSSAELAEVQWMSTAKEELAQLIQQQPDDSSREEIVRELAFHVMVQRGLADSDARRVISSEEMARRIRTWQK